MMLWDQDGRIHAGELFILIHHSMHLCEFNQSRLFSPLFTHIILIITVILEDGHLKDFHCVMIRGGMA